MTEINVVKLNRIFFSKVEYDFTHNPKTNKVNVGVTLQAQVSRKEKKSLLVFKYVMSGTESAKPLIAIDCTLEYEGRVVEDSGKQIDSSLVSEAYGLFKTRLKEFSNAVKIAPLPTPNAVPPAQYQV